MSHHGPQGASGPQKAIETTAPNPQNISVGGETWNTFAGNNKNTQVATFSLPTSAPSVQWTTGSIGDQNNGPATNMVAGPSNLYVHSDERLYALDKDNGTLIYEVQPGPTNRNNPFFESLHYNPSRHEIYVNYQNARDFNDHGFTVGFDATDGTELWAFDHGTDSGGTVYYPANINATSDLVFAYTWQLSGSGPVLMRAIDPNDGSLAWERQADTSTFNFSASQNQPSISTSANRLVFGTEGRFEALNLDDGSLENAVVPGTTDTDAAESLAMDWPKIYLIGGFPDIRPYRIGFDTLALDWENNVSGIDANGPGIYDGEHLWGFTGQADAADYFRFSITDGSVDFQLEYNFASPMFSGQRALSKDGDVIVAPMTGGREPPQVVGLDPNSATELWSDTTVTDAFHTGFGNDGFYVVGPSQTEVSFLA